MGTFYLTTKADEKKGVKSGAYILDDSQFLAPTTQTTKKKKKKEVLANTPTELDILKNDRSYITNKPKYMSPVTAPTPTIQLPDPLQTRNTSFNSNKIQEMNDLKAYLPKTTDEDAFAVTLKEIGKDFKAAKKEALIAKHLLGEVVKGTATGDFNRVERAVLTGNEGATLWDRYILPVANTFNIATKTVLSSGEGAVKSVYNYIATPTQEALHAAGILNDEEYEKAKEDRQNFVKDKSIEKLWRYGLKWDDEVNNYVDRNSIINENNPGGRIIQGLTYSLMMAATGGTSLGWKIPTFLSASGTTMQHEYEKGANDLQAISIGTLGGFIEVGAEMMFGGVLKLPNTGKAASIEALENNLTNKIKSNTLRYLSQFGINVLNEDAEEWIGGIANSIVQRLVYMNDKEKQELYSSEDFLQDFLYTSITTAISGGGKTAFSGGLKQVKQDIQSGRSQITGYTQNEQKIIDAATQEAIQQQQEETGKKLTKKEIAQIEEQVKEDLSKGFIDTNTIEKTLGFDGQQRITEVENMLGRELTQEEKQKELFDARNKFYEGLQNDSYLMESLNEEGKKSQKFEVNINDYQNEAQRNIVQKAIDSGVLNNTRATHEYVDFVSKLCADKGMDFDFTNNEKLKGTRFALEGKTINGFVEGNKITVNVDSNTSLYKTVGHEITHTLEGSDLYTELQSSLKSYLGEREWNNRINELKDLYKDVKDANVENELTADLIGETLFTDKKFINNLSTQNRNVFQKIYNEIKYMYKVATAGSKEKRQLEKVKKLFDEAYRTNTNVSEETKLSVKEGEQLAPFNNEKEIQQQYDNIKNQRDDLRQNLFELRRQRNEIIDTIPNYSMFKQYDELTDIDKQIDDNVAESKRLYSQQQELEQKLTEEKELKKQQEIEEVNKKSTPFKEKQFKVLQKTNPMLDDYHTGIRQPGEIMTWQEAMQDAEKTEDGYSWGDFNKEDAQRALDSKKITIYSSYPIKNGVFVSTSLAQAQMYAGGEGNRVYSKTVNPDFVAWINVDEGQYANVGRNFENNTKYSLTKDNQGRNLTQEQQEYYKDSKVRDQDGNLLVMYNGRYSDDTVFKPSRWTNEKNGPTQIKGYFATESSYSEIYGDVSEYYLNIKNPLYMGLEDGNEALTLNEWQQFFKEHGITGVEFDSSLYGVNTKGNIAPDIDGQRRYLAFEIVDSDEYWNNDGNVTERIKAAGYDGLTWTEGGQAYMPFESNQIKNVDNLNPTENDDIRLSMSNNNDIAPYYPGQITGEDVRLQEEIAPTVETTQELDLPFDVTFDEVKEVLDLPKDVDRTEYLKVSDTNESTGQEYENQYSPFDKAKKDLAQKKLEKFIEKETYKAIDQATNVAARYGEFNKSQKKQIKSELNRFANMTAEQLTNADTYNEFKDIVSQYADREMNFVDEHLKEVKKDVRNRKFNVSDIKDQITDYADFRRQYFGRLNLTNTGSSIDSQYQELSQLYPEYFSPDVTTEADMLNTLAEFMDLDTTITEKYRLSEEEIDRITSKAFSTLVREAPTEQQIQEFEDEIDRALERRRSEVRRQQLLDEMGVTIEDIAAGKDISALGYQRTDPIRLHEKVFGWEVGNKMNDATIRHTIHNEAESMRWTNTEKTEIKDLGIKARSKESAAVQKYGEGEYVNDLGEVVKYGDKELAAEFPDVATQEKIKRAAEVLRGKYDRYIDQINDVLTDLGYDAIPKRQNYFRHFMELNDKFSQWGTPFNRQSMSQEDLPTDINGLTDQFKPGKSYFASALERKGIKTTYDAITGIDGYIDSAANLIFHTEDIQRYRALAKLIRETYGQQHGLDNIDIMTEAEKNQRVEDVYGNKLSKYAAWLDEQANALAGKKGGIDRAVERMFGRKVYTAANTLKTQVGSNMTGFGVRSAMSNFASVVQGMSKTNKISFIKGTISTLQNMIHNDGMEMRSDFLTGRTIDTTPLSQKAWQKIANAGQVFMSATDHFTSNQIWRSKYFENLSRGMTEEQAIKNADDFAARVMGNRVKGSTAEIFNSKTLGFLTQFQLEVNNYWSNIAHDNKIDIKNGNKSGASVVFQLGQLAAFSYIFNGFMKGLTGSEIMLDPIDLLKQIFNPDDDDKEKSLEERARGVMGDIINQLPMASIFTGGRIPIQEAFKGAETGFKYLTNQTNEYGQNYTAGDVFDDSLESLAYLFMPTGYGQLRKTYKGTIDLDYDVNLNPFEGAIGITKRPVRGSYTDTGNLRFTADNSTGGRIRSALFGQYANSEAQDYINSGYKTIPKSRIEELQALEMSSSEYKRWQKDFNDAIATTVEIDGDKYAKYKDDYGNIYFYNKDTRTLLDSDYAESDIDVKTLEKVDKNELIFDYVNNYGFTDEQRQFLYDENFTNTTTDKYGYEKYTGKEVDKKGKTVTKNYYYDPDTDTLYDSKYKEVDSSKLDELTKVAPSKTIQDAEGFDSYEEFDYSYKNPEKYNFIRQTGTYERYKKDKAYKEAVDWSYNTPVNYTMSKAFDENIVAYKEYMDTLNDIKADKDKNGKSISGSRKKKVFNYINSLDLNTEQKAILARSQYSSYDDYGYEIVNYLNNQTNISLEEEYSILEKLGYKIDRNRGTVSW